MEIVEMKWFENSIRRGSFTLKCSDCMFEFKCILLTTDTRCPSCFCKKNEVIGNKGLTLNELFALSSASERDMIRKISNACYPYDWDYEGPTGTSGKYITESDLLDVVDDEEIFEILSSYSFFDENVDATEDIVCLDDIYWAMAFNGVNGAIA